MTTVMATPRIVHVEHCMGTVFTLDVRTPGDWSAAISEAVAWLHHVDAVFSTYRADSDISRIGRSELRVEAADPEVSTVLDLCAEVQVATGGAFTAMPNGRLDPTGLVKGWAIERASQLLTAHGASDHAVNGGGDMQLRGSAGTGRPWRVGIADPNDRARVLAVLAGADLAVATSGTAERGAHILDPFTGRPATAVASATVVGPSLTRADAYATAATVLGRDALGWIAGVPGYELLLVTADGEQLTSGGWARHLAAD
jgi:thiamine biosynthesis lipoprotein